MILGKGGYTFEGEPKNPIPPSKRGQQEQSKPSSEDPMGDLLAKVQESISSLEKEFTEYAGVVEHLRDLMNRFNTKGFPEGPIKLMMNLVRLELERLYPPGERSFKKLAMLHAYIDAFVMAAVQEIAAKTRGTPEDMIDFFSKSFSASAKLLLEQFKKLQEKEERHE